MRRRGRPAGRRAALGRWAGTGFVWLGALCATLLASTAFAIPAQAASKDPIFIYTPEPSPNPPLIPPPAGLLEGPCGLAVDSGGDFYVSDHFHNTLDRFKPAEPLPEYLGQVTDESPEGGPCGLAVDSAGALYVNDFHVDVARYESFPSGTRSTIDPGPATGVAVDPSTGEVYVDDVTGISVYEPSGTPVESGGKPLVIGKGSLEEGYGIAISGYVPTAGFLYVPDAATETVKVYDPAIDTANPVEEIDAGFTSLRNSAVAVDDVTGEVYVADDLQPGAADSPEAAIKVFDSTGSYEGRLKYNIRDARPPGLAVDNSGGEGKEDEGEQGRVYVTSGNTEKASVMGYPPEAAGTESLLAPESPAPLPPGQVGTEFPEPPPPVTCQGDSCQEIPAEPTDPALTTLVEGASNPPVRFHDTNPPSRFRRLLGHHHRRRHRIGPLHRRRIVYLGKTSQKRGIRIALEGRRVYLAGFAARLRCPDGGRLFASVVGFEATFLGRGGRIKDTQFGDGDVVAWKARLGHRKIKGAVAIHARLKGGMGCKSGWVRFTVGRARRKQGRR